MVVIEGSIHRSKGEPACFILWLYLLVPSKTVPVGEVVAVGIVCHPRILGCRDNDETNKLRKPRRSEPVQ